MEEDQSLLDALDHYGRRNEFKAKLDHIHAGLDMESVRLEADTYKGANPSKVRQLWQTYRATLAVAASVAIITTLASILMYRSYQSSHQQQEQYSMLRRDLQAIRRSQSRILNGLGDRSETIRMNPAQVGGSAFVLAPEGYLVTNNHIIQGADSIYVLNIKGEAYKAQVVHANAANDLAILQIIDDTTFRGLPPLPYGFDTKGSDLGERVFTLGFPRDEIVYGEGYLSSNTGFRNDSTAYQVAISVNPGNSGGPLLDESGNIIGVISGKQTMSEGATFAIKTNYLLKTLNALTPDSLRGAKVSFSRKNTIANLPRKEQIKRMKNYVFMVKVFKGEK